MTLPAATADLQSWINDGRKFRSVQRDDWRLVIDDFNLSVKETGPKLTSFVRPTTVRIIALLDKLIVSKLPPNSTTTPFASNLRKVFPHSLADRITRPIDALATKLFLPTQEAKRAMAYSIDQSVRDEIRLHLTQLDVDLASEDAIVAAWRDLMDAVKKVNRPLEQVAFRRDTLFAIAQRRNLHVGKFGFGVFREVGAVLTDAPDAVEAAQAHEAGVEYQRPFPRSEAPSGVPSWRRIQLCEQVLRQPPSRGDCIVWLRLEPTSLPRYEASHGQVTFYNAAILAPSLGHPEYADSFKKPPQELLELDVAGREFEKWDDDWNMAYARVALPNMEIHDAEAKARTLVEALKAVNHAEKDAWQLLNGSILFVDGQLRSLLSWGPKEYIRDMYYAQNDRMARDVAAMSLNDRSIDAESMRDLQLATGMSTTLNLAWQESPQATVIAAVRAIEHVNAWTTGGVKNWTDFASTYFRKGQARQRLVEFIDRVTNAAVESVPDRRPSASAPPELAKIRAKLRVMVGPHEAFHVRAAADHVATLKVIYADHWLARALQELALALDTPAGMCARLEEQGRRFDTHLQRLKRLRNSAIHGGPVSEAGCQSVAIFASNLAHLCLDEAMTALLTGQDVASHMESYRAGEVARMERVYDFGDIDALFVEPEVEPFD